MTSDVHEFEAREGGSFRVSLTYDAPDAARKTAAHTDTYHGHFARLVPGEQVVEVLEFETADPDLAGEMTITTTLTTWMGAPRSPSCTRGCHGAFPRPTTSWARGWRSVISPRWLRSARVSLRYGGRGRR